MGKALVIVESPAKAKTINKYLGKNYIVKSSVGHIRDLPTSGSAARKPVDHKARAKQAAATRKMSPKDKAAFKKKRAQEQLITRMGINPEKDWEATYEILPGKEKVITELRKHAENADEIYLATDLDREGEAIAWHLRVAIGGDLERYRRVVFNEITKKAITAAFESPDELNMDRVQAQQTRRFLDRVVGYMVSPLLWAKVARGLSAGRVQSVAVRLLVEREKLIRAFIPEEYWEVYADLKLKQGDEINCQVYKKDGETFRPVSEKETQAALKILEAAEYKITKKQERPTRTNPAAPFITSTLQQAASTRLGFGVKKTMAMAQRLYEAGHITYMRTDSTNLSEDAVSASRDFIQQTYGDKYLPDAAISYSSKKGAQEAHEAIRPSDVNLRPVQLEENSGGLDPDALRLYGLIWQRFVACQMTRAEYLSTSITIEAAGYELRTRGRVMLFDGYTKVMPALGKGDQDQELPKGLEEGQVLNLKELDPRQLYTKPPQRFSEAGLVKELEKQGIGRPSTYASIISTIQDRGYVRLQNRRFYAEKIGYIVTERLIDNFENLMDFGFTAEMEGTLDDVANGKISWKKVLNEFYKDFRKKLEVAESENGKGMRPNDPTDTDVECPKCGRHMQIRTASTGVFLGCSGYALPPKERCKSTINLVSGDDVEDINDDEERDKREIILLTHKRRCPKCQTAMDSYLIDESRKLHVCGNNPDCDGFEVEAGQFKIKGYDGPIVECEKCGHDMQLKSGRFGKYFGCTNEECSNTRKLMRNGEASPPRMDPIPMPDLACERVEDHYLLREGAGGLFLAASQFPKHREIRNPKIEELIPLKDRLQEKFHYLLEAPTEDKEGNKSIVRWSRKNQEQYVMTEVEKKATGWKARFLEGKWVVEEPVKKVAKKAAKKTAKKATKKAAKKTAKKTTKKTTKKAATKKT